MSNIAFDNAIIIGHGDLNRFFNTGSTPYIILNTYNSYK